MAQIFCPICNGSGNENKQGYKRVKCSLCDGTGTIDSEMMDSLTENIPMDERE
jgi:DnaJ-class molecular chaperone